jgi:hypothetical protein
MNWARIQRLLPQVLLLFSLACACFLYGLAAGRYKVFPYRILRDARTAFIALAGAREPADQLGLATYRRQVLAPTATQYAAEVGDEMFLVSGGAGYLQDHHPDGCLAWLIDRRGDIKHIWKHDPSVWKTLELVTRVPGLSGEAYPVGMHLFDDGGLLVTYHAANTFPFAVGLARFDVHSNLLWKKELFTHHWLTVTPDGRIFVPAVRIVDAPIPIGQTEACITSDGGKVYSDVILILDANGHELDEISMLDALFASGWSGLFTRPDSAAHSADLLTDDPLHLNDIQLVSDRCAASQPWLSPGDWLVSFRNINTIGILDPVSRRFKWLSSGAVVGQHSPRCLDRGVLVLDNLGGDRRLGGTQLVLIDFDRGLPTRVFPNADVATPDLCRTLNSGHLDVHRDGHHVLMTVTHQGTLWEIDLRTGEVLWEYIYVHPHGNGRRVGIHTAKYAYDPAFLPR